MATSKPDLVRGIFRGPRTGVDSEGDVNDEDDLQARFDALVQKSQELLENPPRNIRFRPSRALVERMYALYKQATEGDVTGPRPSLLHPMQRMKYDAREKIRGMDRTEAMREYVETAEKLAAEHLPES